MTTWADVFRANASDVTRIVERLFLDRGDRRRNYSSFAILLALSGVIATAGVVVTSTATVIGAMIVAPLMTPILGTALAIVLADHRQVLRNVLVVTLASIAVVVIGYLIGLLVQLPVTAATNSEVAGRVSPGLIDLLAAIATGLVGAFAVARSDVSDTLPGVAIAISLVPPLAVVGLTLEAGAGDEAIGALLLFGTNVAAIIATGTAVLLAVGIRGAAPSAGVDVGTLRGRTLVVVAASLLLLVGPLSAGSATVLRQQTLLAQSKTVARDWADERGWELSDVFVRGTTLHVVALGLKPTNELGVNELRDDLDAAGVSGVGDVEVTLVLGGSRTASATA
ncbi:DUF389 domain-containing protein [Nocardioides sp. GY 10113]|uniref:DUF389 domain-containing protein n=1 Tax=Nocardioides sp. GY 10113 TaxID=2569761 RepID=UPI0010A8BFA0|nr:DUF389 domain-containing protein [Nocardioides sp. GY 10113]TIC88849.1 DUF389 domain-containing protein [Nocardioides sp. GY 10113]